MQEQASVNKKNNDGLLPVWTTYLELLSSKTAVRRALGNIPSGDDGDEHDDVTIIRDDTTTLSTTTTTTTKAAAFSDETPKLASIPPTHAPTPWNHNF